MDSNTPVGNDWRIKLVHMSDWTDKLMVFESLLADISGDHPISHKLLGCGYSCKWLCAEGLV